MQHPQDPVKKKAFPFFNVFSFISGALRFTSPFFSAAASHQEKKTSRLGGAMVSMQPFQGCGPGSIPGQVTFRLFLFSFSFFFLFFFFLFHSQHHHPPRPAPTPLFLPWRAFLPLSCSFFSSPQPPEIKEQKQTNKPRGLFLFLFFSSFTVCVFPVSLLFEKVPPHEAKVAVEES